MNAKDRSTEEAKVLYKLEFVREEGSTVPGQRKIGCYVTAATCQTAVVLVADSYFLSTPPSLLRIRGYYHLHLAIPFRHSLDTIEADRAVFTVNSA